jgi:hypothetical protein
LTILQSVHPISSSKALLLPALIVYAWLPLFALSVVVLRVAGWTLKSVTKVQWFLKAGKKHPLHAIGLVASATVFSGITLGRLLVK